MSTNGATKPPVREQGYLVPGLEIPGLDMGFGWGTFLPDAEHVPDLRWPNSIQVYDKMRADPQIDALLRGMFLPIRRFKWSLDPGDANMTAVRMLAEDLKIPILGEPRPKRTRQSFSFSDHLRHALLGLVYGHMFFEQVGTIEGTGSSQKWRLRKLAPRMPASISEFKIARDGGLEWIQQREEWNPPKLKIGSLLAYVFDKEGANWIGRSLLRSAYQPWLLKDRLLRVDGIRHERNGMGVPIVELPERATDTQRREANALAQQYKTGMASGGAVPFGMKVRLVGVEGSTSDVLASIRYHDEAMAKLMLQMFVSLGGAESGSRALGDTFVKFFAKAQESVAEWFSETFMDHMIADWMEWNYGPDEEIPTLIFKRDEDPELSAHELSQMVAMEVLTVDEELENFLRDKYALPPLKGKRPPSQKNSNTPENFPPDEGEPNENVNEPPPERPASAAISPLQTTTRFRREYTDVEAASGADFPSIQAEWEQAVREAVSTWRGIRDEHIEELVDAVRSAQGTAELGNIEPSLRGVDEIDAYLQRMSVAGVEQAVAEAARQGVDLPRVDAPGTRPLAEAIAKVVARGLGASAARVATRSGPGEPGAAAVRAWANTLTDVYLEETLGGTLTSAQNLGRFAVWGQAGEDARFFASEVLDANVCGPCANVDKKPYASLEEAYQDYPSGMYAHCVAGSRCRGTIIAVFGSGLL